MHFRCSGYHEKNYRPYSLKTQVNRIVRNLEKLKLRKKIKFDAIAFRGMSGAAVAYPVSVLAGYHLIAVRRKSDDAFAHHGRPIEGSESRMIRRYLILDDFVSSGDTVNAIVEAINKEAGKFNDPPECVGIAVYNRDVSRRNGVMVDGVHIPIFLV